MAAHQKQFRHGRNLKVTKTWPRLGYDSQSKLGRQQNDQVLSVGSIGNTVFTLSHKADLAAIVQSNLICEDDVTSGP